MKPIAILLLAPLGVVVITPCGRRPTETPETKKADVVEYLEAFDHVGLLVNEPPGPAGLPFI
jgi:hypothetical protein